MTKRDVKGALGATLQAEEEAVKSRFEKAESVLSGRKNGKGSAPPKQGTGNEARVIRDSFTMPEADYELIGPLKKRCMKAGIGVNKSELLRAGLRALTEMSDRELAQHVDRLVRIKPGRRPKL